MQDLFSRSELLWGKDVQNALSKKCVIVAGLGGVGGYTLDALARIGIENFKIVDFDTVEKSNINRQLIALNSTVGQSKVDLFEQRLLDINPNINVKKFNCFYSNELNNEIFTNVDYVADAIDTMKYKVELIESSIKYNVQVVSAFGAGNRLDPTKIRIDDISKIGKTKCAFSNNILYQLKKREITTGVTAVFSDETPIKPETKTVGELSDGSKKIQVGSCVFVPAVMGYYIAYAIIKDLIK